MPFFTTHRHTKGSVPKESTTCSNIFRSNSGGTTSPQIPLFSAAPVSVSTLAGRQLLDLFDFLRGACFSLTSDMRLFGETVEFLDEMIWKVYIYLCLSLCAYINTTYIFMCIHEVHMHTRTRTHILLHTRTRTHTFTYHASMMYADT